MASIFNQKFFNDLNDELGIELENIVYYKDETHYFVMTAKKQSLLNKGVLITNHPDPSALLPLTTSRRRLCSSTPGRPRTSPPRASCLTWTLR